MKLKDYATIRTGLVLARKEAKEDDSSYKYPLLSLKNVSDDGRIQRSELENYFATDKLKKEYFSQRGDILVRLISPYTAVHISNTDTDVLIPAHFAIIRTDERIDPHYLHWWLTKNKKKFMQMASGGTVVGTISSGYIADMDFDPPPIAEQRKIAKIYELSQKEQQLLSKLAKVKKQYTDAVLTRIARIGETTL